MNTASEKQNRQVEVLRWGPDIRTDDIIFRLWAPGERHVGLELSGRTHEMKAMEDGWFEYRAGIAALGSDYRFILSDGLAVPDPASRGQADDVHGPSRIVADDYEWTQDAWRGRPWEEAVICELHVGTFTPEGTFQAAIAKLPHLADAGITAIEIMPVAHFAGTRGWGYDGVLHYAPHTAYGSPRDMKAFIDAAHGLGIMVLLDVVYNHFGPEGNYLHRYASDFFRTDRQTPWGAAIDFGQPAVRRYFIDNALYWIGEFRLDGLRFDAIEHIVDSSARHILTEIADTVHTAFSDRQVHLAVEDQRNDVGLLLRDGRGRPKTFTAEWNDDFHHVAHVLATGETGGHYERFSSDASGGFAASLQSGFLFPNCGTSAVATMTGTGDVALPPTCFINFLQNHDQTGNRAFGERLLSLADPDMVKALTAILLLSPQIPLLFMGEEFGETQPFYYFCDYGGELGDIIRKGRAREAEGFGGMKPGKSLADLPDPNARSTFEGSKLDWRGRDGEHGKAWLGLVRNLLALRRAHVVPLLKAAASPKSDLQSGKDGVIGVSWAFEGGTLALRANLSGERRRVPPFDGEVIYSLHGAAEPGDGTLAAAAVVFSLDRAAIEAG
jgi:maltooligosyltrehalose trehalohydrolase